MIGKPKPSRFETVEIAHSQMTSIHDSGGLCSIWVLLKPALLALACIALHEALEGPWCLIGISGTVCLLSIDVVKSCPPDVRMLVQGVEEIMNFLGILKTFR